MVKQTVKETSIKDLIQVIKGIEKPPYSVAQEGWLGWLREYDGPGAYHRKPGMAYSARFMYNHNASPTGLLWLIKSLGVNQDLIKLAEKDYQKIKRVSEDVHTQSAAIRKRIPWAVVDRALAERLLALDKAYQRKLQRVKRAMLDL